MNRTRLLGKVVLLVKLSVTVAIAEVVSYALVRSKTGYGLLALLIITGCVSAFYMALRLYDSIEEAGK